MREFINLNGEWKLNFFAWKTGEDYQPWLTEFDDSDWMLANVPGDVHLDLMTYGKIPDPFWNRNADQCRWVEEVDWWYRKYFSLPKAILNRPLILRFNGLDCFATIYLNGKIIGTHENMFVECEFDISQHAQEKNLLVIKLASPIKSVEKKDITHFSGVNHEQRVYARKSQMSYGWDFVPHLVTIGIWKDVGIDIIDGLRIEDVCLRTKIIKETTVCLYYEIMVKNFTSKSIDTTIKIEGKPFNFSGKKFSLDRMVSINAKTEKRIKGEIKLQDVHLWYPQTLGEPNLYTIIINVNSGTQIVDQKKIRYGFRAVKVIQKVDDEQNPHRFFFVINGKPIFAKGANWVIPDAILARASKDKYYKLLKMAKNANMNFLRVWGGGIPESDIFYEICDELGIMVWQDFNFACSDYPEDDEFKELVKYEAEKIIKRLRNHASLVMWCGSNETLWEHQYGAVLFYVILRDACERLDPTRLYWYSSPFGGCYPNSPAEGNEHNWYVWLGFKPYRTYVEDTACFVSEFGMQAAPHLKTWQSCFSEDQLSAISVQNEMNSDTPTGFRPSLSKDCTDFQYHGFQTNKFQIYSKEFGDIRTVEDLIRVTQLMQATGVKYGVEHFRRSKYKCGGTLFWQFNDIWPTTSYSCIDYYLRPKILYYFAKRFFNPVLVSFMENSEGVSIWLTNDLNKRLNGLLTVSLEQFTGEKIWQTHIDTEIKSDESICVLEIPNKHFENVDPNCVVLWGQFEYDKKIISRNYYFFTEHRHLQFPVANLSLKKKVKRDNFTELSISTDSYARLVMIETEDKNAILENNYFDLRAEESRSVQITWLEKEDSKDKRIKVSAWNSKSSLKSVV